MEFFKKIIKHAARLSDTLEYVGRRSEENIFSKQKKRKTMFFLVNLQQDRVTQLKYFIILFQSLVWTLV